MELPLPEKMKNPNQYHTPRGIKEISATIKDLEEPGVVVPITPPFRSPTLPGSEDGPWRMTVDYLRLIQVLILIAAALPDVVSLLEQTNTFPGTWYTAIDLQMPFPKDHWKQFVFRWRGQQ